MAALARMTAVTSAVLRDGQVQAHTERGAGARRRAGARRGRRRGRRRAPAAGRVAARAGSLAHRRERGGAQGRVDAARPRPRSATASTWCSRAPPSRRAPAAPSSPRPACTPRWARSPTCSRRPRRSRTPLQNEVARIGRMLGIAVVVIARRGGGDRRCSISDMRDRRRRHHRAAARRVARGRRRARGPAGDPVGRAGAGRAAHGEAQRHREEAFVGGDAGLGLGDLLGQDRHPDPLGDDHRAGDDRLGRARVTGVGYAPRGRVEHEGKASDGPRAAETSSCSAAAAWPAMPTCGRPRTAYGRSRATRPRRRSWSPSASSA